MTQIPMDLLRALVSEAVREAVQESPSARPSEPSARAVAGAQFVTREEPRQRTLSVRLTTDDDVADFVRQLLGLFENPKSREELRNGWLRFTLAGAAPASGSAPTHRGQGAIRVERGVLTERQVAAAAETGQSIVVARAAVITPLARDKARALGVHIEKERR